MLDLHAKFFYTFTQKFSLMHKIINLFIALFGIVFYCSADIIFFSSGISQEVEIKEITPTEIKYTKTSRANGPLYTVLKSDVVSIKYENGTIETFDTNMATSIGPSSPKSNNIYAESNIFEKKKYEAAIYYLGKETNKEARACYGLCRFDEESVLCDGNIMLEYSCGIYSPFVKNNSNMVISVNEGPFWLENISNKPIVFWNAIKVKLHNLSSKTIYVDLANTFFKRGSLASPYFVPSSTTNLQSETNGIGLNLGGITNALGIGGSVGNWASGINVGTSSTSGTVTTIYSQRIISIPPQSSIELSPQLLFPPNLPTGAYKVATKHYGYSFGTWQLVGLDKTNLSINIGQTKNYDENSSPISFGIFLSYSFNERFSEIKSVNNTAYLTRLIGLERYKPAANSRFHTKNADKLSEGFLKPLHFFIFIH